MRHLNSCGLLFSILCLFPLTQWPQFLHHIKLYIFWKKFIHTLIWPGPFNWIMRSCSVTRINATPKAIHVRLNRLCSHSQRTQRSQIVISTNKKMSNPFVRTQFHQAAPPVFVPEAIYFEWKAAKINSNFAIQSSRCMFPSHFIYFIAFSLQRWVFTCRICLPTDGSPVHSNRQWAEQWAIVLCVCVSHLMNAKSASQSFLMTAYSYSQWSHLQRRRPNTHNFIAIHSNYYGKKIFKWKRKWTYEHE